MTQDPTPEDVEEMDPAQYARYFREEMGQLRTDSGSMRLLVSSFTDPELLSQARVFNDGLQLTGIAHVVAEHVDSPVTGIWHDAKSGEPMVLTEATTVEGSQLPEEVRGSDLRLNLLYMSLRERMVPDKDAGPYLPLDTIGTVLTGTRNEYIASVAHAIEELDKINNAITIAAEDFDALAYAAHLCVQNAQHLGLSDTEVKALKHAHRGRAAGSEHQKQLLREHFDRSVAIIDTYQTD